MTRSAKKGPFVYERLLKKIEGKRPHEVGVVKTWERRAVITPEMVAYTFGVYNGRQHVEVTATEDMIGHRRGQVDKGCDRDAGGQEVRRVSI